MAGAVPLLTYYMTNCHVPSSHELVASEEGIWSDLELEEALVAGTNRVRAEHGLSILLHDAVIREIARGHSVNIARQNVMDQELDGLDPTDRALLGG